MLSGGWGILHIVSDGSRAVVAITEGAGGTGGRAHTELEGRQDPLVEENDSSTERDPETAKKDES